MSSEPLRRQFLKKWFRTLHIYLSMMGLVLVFFFSATGFMLNHEDWFGLGDIETRTENVTVPAKLLAAPDKLGVVEWLRQECHVTGAVASFGVEEAALQISFRSPGRQCVVAINRSSGEAQLEFQWQGVLGRINELHRGLDAGPAWKLVIDLSALLLAISAGTGLFLWSLVPKWRAYGIAAVVVSVAACLAVYFLAVP